MRTVLVLIVATLLLAAVSASGQVPEKMNYQVMLTNDSDEPLANESVQLVFRIYNVDAGGASLWTETHNVVTNSIGVVSVVLGTYNPLSLAFEGPLWLQVAVDGETMLPRRELTSAPYALSVDAGVSGDGHSLDADDGSPVDVVYVDADGIVEFGSSVSDGVAEFYTAGVADPVLELISQERGGEVELYEENGDRYGFIEPDVNGTGGYLMIYDSGHYDGFFVDGNNTGGSAYVGIYGSASWTGFNTGLPGDDAVELPSDAVSAPEILDEPGAASTSGYFSIDLTGSIQTLLSRSITVPAPGYVLAIASAEIVINHSNGTTSGCNFGVSNSSSSYPLGGELYFRLPNTAPDGAWYPGLTVQWLFEVATAGTHTFYFIGDETVGSWQVYDRNMTLLYIPSAYGGIASTVTAPPSNPEEMTVQAGRALTEADIATERAESEAFNNVRIERELAEMEAKIAELRASMRNNRP